MNKMPIRIIDKDFNILAEIDDYESLIFIRRFFKVGDFELHININKQHTDKLIEGNMILLGNKLNKVGIIMHKENAYDQNGEPTDTLLIKGPTLKGLCSRRLMVPPTGAYDSFTGSQEAIMKYFVEKNCVNPTDTLRKIQNLVIAPNLNRGIQDKWRSRYENLADKLDTIGEYSNLGWDITFDFDNNKFVFDVIQGRDLTADQELLPPVIFSVDFDNLKSRHYIDSAINYKNVGYCGGKGDDENRLIQQIGEISGFERIETFIDCSQAEDVTELKTIGNQKLNEFKKVRSFEVQIIPEGSFYYEQDYDLGDIITAQDRKLGITMNARIIELKEIYEVGGFNLEATLGTNIPNLLTLFKKETKRVVR
ncbi:siphovirus ReqiPepy6 Gp37-like family protein [Clostridium gasigenes]|uniref:Siphovirus ReqiPepy6 Gp37-like family protein n=1 Tax=Clostridium gasigenes TaxID=94869 RepID=A0A7X0SEU1_9CLOT|nr:siphovirus ReqiPepy6 Gp37-like family protein [Clostridium gasigenes]MBB6716277.1 siphovirus ReqiPepy6 Gp37-like family protein [Clostridium gasigenes]